MHTLVATTWLLDAEVLGQGVPGPGFHASAGLPETSMGCRPAGIASEPTPFCRNGQLCADCWSVGAARSDCLLKDVTTHV